METIYLIFAVVGVLAAIVMFVLSGAKDKKLAAMNQSLNDAEKKLQEQGKSPANKPAEKTDTKAEAKSAAEAEKKLKAAQADVERLTKEVAKAEEALKKEKEAVVSIRAEVATAKASAEKATAALAEAEKSATTPRSEEAVVATLRSKLAEANHKTEELTAQLAQITTVHEKELNLAAERVRQLEETTAKAAKSPAPATATNGSGVTLPDPVLLFGIGNELRTSASAIVGFTEILQDKTFGDLTPKQDRYVTSILSSGRTLLHTLDDLTEMGKSEADLKEARPDSLPIGPLAKSLETLTKPFAAKNGVTLIVEVGDSAPTLLTVPALGKQCLYHLIMTALAHTGKGETATVTAVAEGEKATVSVTYVGATPEENAFAVVRSLAERQGGTYAWSKQGKGTVLSVTLPHAPKSFLAKTPSSKMETVSARSVVAPDADKSHVLIIDADKAGADLLTQHLQGAGYTVSLATNAADGLKMAKELHPSAIAMDIALNDRDGYELLTELKTDSITKEVPVLVISAVKDKQKAMDLGAHACFSKPAEKNTLLGGLRAALIARRKRQERQAMLKKVSGISASGGTRAKALKVETEEPVAAE